MSTRRHKSQHPANAELDINAVSRTWLQLCASCDAGLPHACTCPPGDYRPTMLALVREVERLRAEVAWLTGGRKPQARS